MCTETEGLWATQTPPHVTPAVTLGCFGMDLGGNQSKCLFPLTSIQLDQPANIKDFPKLTMYHVPIELSCNFYLYGDIIFVLWNIALSFIWTSSKWLDEVQSCVCTHIIGKNGLSMSVKD